MLPKVYRDHKAYKDHRASEVIGVIGVSKA
jgi:hypothetical protein